MQPVNRTWVFAFLWAGLWLFFGLMLDALHGTKQLSYLADPIRREMWRLAHAHGMLLAMMFLLASRFLGMKPSREILMLVGMILMPLGFFLGGVVTTETDPFIGVVLVPVGGFAYVLAFVVAAWEAWRRR